MTCFRERYGERVARAMVVVSLGLLAPTGLLAATGRPRESRSALAIQVALDRAGFSPGEIDGRPGKNTHAARVAFEREHGELRPAEEPLMTYRISAEDASGPFLEKLPERTMDLASLPELGFTSILEMLAERFHASPRLLIALNRSSRFEVGDEIRVPDVEPHDDPDEGGPPRRTVVRVFPAMGRLVVEDDAGRTLMAAPVTAGSERDPLVPGEMKVTGVTPDPRFEYDPALFWDAPPGDEKATIAPGPNNPVGVLWIDLDRPHYGIHGTPEPSHIGRRESHGCVRLTNWDVRRLRRFVEVGTRVIVE